MVSSKQTRPYAVWRVEAEGSAGGDCYGRFVVYIVTDDRKIPPIPSDYRCNCDDPSCDRRVMWRMLSYTLVTLTEDPSKFRVPSDGVTDRLYDGTSCTREVLEK